MKQKGNGGYQIIDFEGQAPETLDVTFFDGCLKRGKPLYVNNLVVDGETYCGVGSLKKTLTSLIITIATINIVIALSDGSTTYEAIDEVLEIDGDDFVFEDTTGTTSFNNLPLAQKIVDLFNKNKLPLLILNKTTKVDCDVFYNGENTQEIYLNIKAYPTLHKGLQGGETQYEIIAPICEVGQGFEYDGSTYQSSTCAFIRLTATITMDELQSSIRVAIISRCAEE